MLQAQLDAMKEMTAQKVYELRKQLADGAAGTPASTSSASASGDSDEFRRLRSRSSRLADEVVVLRGKLRAMAADRLGISA